MRRVFSLLIVTFLLISLLSGFTIKSISNMKVNVSLNSKYILPKTVTAKLTDGLSKKLSIVWKTTKVNTSKVGKFYYYGKVNGYKPLIKLEVNVYYKENKTESLFKDVDKFNFALDYGFRLTNTIDAVYGTYERRTITGAAISTKLVISKEEKQKIMDCMRKIDLLSYPQDIDSYLTKDYTELEKGSKYSSYSSYALLVNYDGRNILFSWDDAYMDESVKGKNFRSMLYTIIEVVKSHDEYKALPEPPGYE